MKYYFVHKAMQKISFKSYGWGLLVCSFLHILLRKIKNVTLLSLEFPCKMTFSHSQKRTSLAQDFDFQGKIRYRSDSVLKKNLLNL